MGDFFIGYTAHSLFVDVTNLVAAIGVIIAIRRGIQTALAVEEVRKNTDGLVQAQVKTATAAGSAAGLAVGLEAGRVLGTAEEAARAKTDKP